MTLFGPCSIDRKCGVNVQKRHLVAELKLKMSPFGYLTFSISALPLGGIFPLLLHISHLWTVGQKSIIQIFDTSWLDKNIRQNAKHECFWASYTSGTLYKRITKILSNSYLVGGVIMVVVISSIHFPLTIFKMPEATCV